MAVVDELIAVLGFDLEGEANARKFNSLIGQADGKLKKFSGGVAKYGGILATVAGAGMAALGKGVIDTTAEFEGFQATLETIEGSAEKASASLDWIAEFTRTTSYELAGVADSFVALKAYGIDPVANDTLRILGDTASAMNKPLKQAVEAFADAATGEFERLKEFGIRAKQTSEEVTFSWTRDGKQLTKVVKNNGEEIRKFLLENMGDRFNGAMIRKSKTWSGMMSNLGDSWTMFQRKIGDKGFFQTVQGYLGGVLDKIGELDANGTLDVWANNLSEGFIFTAEKLGFLVERLSTHAVFLAENFEQLEGPIYAVAAAFAVLIARAKPALAIMVALGLAADDVLTYMEGADGSVFGENVQSLQDSLGISKNLAESIVGVFGALGGILAAALIYKPAILFTGLGAKILSVLGVVAAAVSAVILLARYDLPQAWQDALKPLFDFEDKVNEFFEGLEFFQSGREMMDSLFEGMDSLPARIKEIPDRIDEYFLSLNFFQTGQQMMDSLFEGMDSLPERLNGIGQGMMIALFEGMKSVGAQIKSWFAGLIPDWAKGFVGGGGGESAANPMAIGAIATGVSNFQANNARAESGMAAEVNNLTDNRNQAMTNNVTVNQTVTQATDAPAAAAQATGNATASAASQQRTQIEAEPAIP